MKLNFAAIAHATEMFEELGWSADNKLFARFCSMLSRMDGPEQELLLTITRDFFHCHLGRYEKAVEDTVSILMPHLGGKTEIILAPLGKESDQGRIKSGAMAVYLIRIRLEPLARIRRIRFAHIDRMASLEHSKGMRRGAVVILADDFVGSGDTAIAAAKWFWEKLSSSTDSLIIAPLVAQQQGLASIRQSGHPCVVAAGHVRDKGITDSKRLMDPAKAHRIMDELEQRLGVPPDCRRGYGGCEALVAMARCPNNTFPVYWRERDGRGGTWPAPFLR